MKRTGGKNIKTRAVLLAATAILWITTAALCVSSVFGWLITGAGTVGASDVRVRFKGSSSDAEFTVYAYDLSRKTAVTEYIEEDGTVGESISVAAIEFQPYDRTFTQDNVYTPIFVKISVRADSVPQNGTVRAIITRNPTPQATFGGVAATLEDDTVMNRITPRCSGIMRFSLGVFGALEEIAQAGGEEDKTALYEAVRAYNDGENAPEHKTFVTTEYSGGEKIYIKSRSISLSATYTAEDFNGDKLILYLYIKYDEYLIGEYLSGIIDVGAEGANDSVMINDLTGLIIAFDG